VVLPLLPLFHIDSVVSFPAGRLPFSKNAGLLFFTSLFSPASLAIPLFLSSLPTVATFRPKPGTFLLVGDMSRREVPLFPLWPSFFFFLRRPRLFFFFFFPPVPTGNGRRRPLWNRRDQQVRLPLSSPSTFRDGLLPPPLLSPGYRRKNLFPFSLPPCPPQPPLFLSLSTDQRT